MINIDTRWSGTQANACSNRLGAAGLTLLLFLIAQFAGMIRRVVMSYFWEDYNSLAAALTYGSILILPICLALYSQTTPSRSAGNLSNRFWGRLMLVCASLSLLYGVLRGYAIREGFQDYAPYVILYCFALLGSNGRFWSDLQRMLPGFVMAAVIVNLIGFRDYFEISIGNEHQRIARDTLAYSTQATLDFWPLLLLTYTGRSFIVSKTAALAAFFALAQQILFQKRLGSVLVLGYILTAIVVVPLIARKFKQPGIIGSGSIIGPSFLGPAALLLGLYLTVQPTIVVNQFTAMLDRFQGHAAGQDATGAGVLQTLMVENERFVIASDMFADFEGVDYIVGRGMGGHFQVDLQLSESVEKSQEQLAAYYLEDVGVPGRRALEVGILMPFLKGGVILTLVYLLWVGSALGQRRSCFLDRTSTACWLILLIESLLLIQAGGFSMSLSYKLAVIGACVGRCSSHVALRLTAAFSLADNPTGAQQAPFPRPLPN